MTDTATWPAPSSAMAPVPYRVRDRVAENRDSATLSLKPVREPLPAPRPGEFMMMYAFGIGEIAVSVSGVPTATDAFITHTIRSVGAVSRALHDAQPGTVIGMRGPFGTNWGLADAEGRDLVIVAGGVGLAPLRPVVLGALAERDRFGRVTLIAGARSRDDFLFGEELAELGTRRLHRRASDRRRSGAGLAGRGRVRHRAAAPGAAAARPHHRVPVRPRADDAQRRHRAAAKGHGRQQYSGVPRTEHAVWDRLVRALPAGSAAVVPRRAGRRL